VPRGGGTMGSRSLQLGGWAALNASEHLVAGAAEVAADYLEAAAVDVVFDRDRAVFHVAGTPARSVTWSDVAGHAFERDGELLSAETDVLATGPTYPFGAHVAVVAVDIETGAVRLERLVACDDAGRILNPLLADGQRLGGIAQGVAQALLEEVRYSDDGTPLTTNLSDYTFISACELPRIELIAHETPTPHNPLGAKGIGESGTIGATPAVRAAVLDALAPFGVTEIDMPASPERVWCALQAAGRSDPRR